MTITTLFLGFWILFSVLLVRSTNLTSKVIGLWAMIIGIISLGVTLEEAGLL